MRNTDSDHDKAESDETSKVEQLENRVEELESKLNNEMTRRALIAAGGVAGGGVLGTLFGSQRASAQTDPLVLRNVDQLGTSSNPVQDLYVENLTNYSSSETFDDLTVNNGADVGSLSAESANIGGGDVFRRVSRKTPSSGTATIQFSGLNDDVEYRLFYSTSTGGDIFLRFNGDGASTGNYVYWDESGTRQSGQNEVLLTAISATTAVGGAVTIGTPWYTNTAERIAANHRLLPGNPGRTDGFGREGARDTQESLTSIEIITSDSMIGGDTVVELWERDYR